MELRFSTSTEVNAPRERLVVINHSASLEVFQLVDPRFVSVETNGLPDGDPGLTVTAVRQVGKRTQTIVGRRLGCQLPEWCTEEVTGNGPPYVIRTQYTVLTPERTAVSVEASFTVPWWNPVLAVMVRVLGPRSIRTALARSKELAERH